MPAEFAQIGVLHRRQCIRPLHASYSSGTLSVDADATPIFFAYKRVHVFAEDTITHSVTTELQPSNFYTILPSSHIHTMICSAPFAIVFLFVQTALALPQAGSASTPPMSNTTSYSSTGANSYSSTATPYSTTGSTPQYTSSSSPYASSSVCPCPTPSSYSPTGKNSTSYSSGSYTSSSCSCYSSTPYSSQPVYTSSSSPYSSQPVYTSSSSYPSQPVYTSSSNSYPPKESKPCPPPSKGAEPPKSSPSPSTTPTLRATFDTFYDNKSGSMNNVACSNGANGLVARFPTFGDVPTFPAIGGAFDVVWNSPNCGSCWTLTNPATGVSINMVAVDTAGAGFNIAQEAFVQLNGGQVGQGVLDVVASKVAPSVCGL